MYKKVIVIAVVSILSLFLFTGCIPKGYTREEENDFLREAKKAALAYLESAYSGAVIEEIGAETTVENSEYVLTEFARGCFRWQEHSYVFVVNAETGKVYTSVCLREISERLQEALIQELGIDSYEEIGCGYAIYYLKDRCGADRSTFFNVFPEGEPVEELLQKVLTDKEAYSFSMDIQYKGRDIPQEIMEEDAPFPTLERITIYHIAKEHELYKEGYFPNNLIVLSKEILGRNYREESAEYTRNRIMESNGLRMVYNAYERTREQDTITENRISEKDISMTVTEEYIIPDCTKEHFAMYFMTADKKITEEYLYTFNDIIDRNTPREGVWIPYGDIYIYCSDLEIPRRFVMRREGRKNIIFSEQGYEECKKNPEKFF